jgi:fatty-acyl-CoA synthase
VTSDSLCALVYTSGTTGLPKAVMQSHRSMTSAVVDGGKAFNVSRARRIWNAVRFIFKDPRWLKWSTKQGTMMAPAPMHALLGYSATIYSLLYGSRVVVAERFHPARVLELVEKEHVNTIIASPTMVTAILNSPDLAKRDLSTLLSVVISSAPCPPELAHRARAELKCLVSITFGATEVGGAILMTNGMDADNLQTETVGRVLPGMGVRVVDDARQPVAAGQVGELALKLSSSMMGYYKAPELTAQALDADGWYYTGDLATMDAQGYVRIVGRKKDMIIRGGQNVFPAEIERHLLTKPGIDSVAVVGVPDPLAGERVWAYVVAQPGTNLSPQDVLNYCRGELAAYKVPDQARIVASLPTTSTGKVQKFALRDLALRELAENVTQPVPRV